MTDDLDDLLVLTNPHPAGVAGPTPPMPRFRDRRRRRRAWIAFPALAVAIGATTAGSFALKSQPATPLTLASVYCELDVSFQNSLGIPADGSDPVAQCAAEWRAGHMTVGSTAVPPLAACVDRGSVMVFPATNACTRLAMHPFQGYSPEQLSAIELGTDLRTLLTPCRTITEALPLVRDELDRTGHQGWKVYVTRTGPCVGAYVDLGMKAVYLSGE